MKPVDVKSSAYVNSDKEIYDKSPKFKISDIIKILKYFCQRLHFKLV